MVTRPSASRLKGDCDSPGRQVSPVMEVSNNNMVCVCACACVCMCVCACMDMCAYVCVSECACVCAYMCVLVYASVCEPSTKKFATLLNTVDKRVFRHCYTLF